MSIVVTSPRRMRHASRIAKLSARGRNTTEIAVRLGVSTVYVCQVLSMQAERAAWMELQRPPKPPRVATAPRGPLPPGANHTADVNAYIPTRAEIREKCREIRKTWSRHERASRYYLARTDSWTISAQQLRELATFRIPLNVVPLVA